MTFAAPPRSLPSRLPAPLGGLARLAYNYHWSWQAGGAALFARHRPRRAGRASRGNPVRLLEEAAPELRRGARPPTRAFARARSRGARSALDADLARPPAAGAADARASRRLLLRRVRRARLAADLLRRPRRARRRLPQAGLRRRAAARRRRPALPPGLLPPARRRRRPPARVLDRHRPRAPAGGARHGRRRRARSRCRSRSATRTCRARSGASTSAACRSTCSTATAPRTRRTARWIAARLYIGDPDAAPRPVSAARRRRHARARGDGDRPGAPAPQRGPCRVRRARARAAPDGAPGAPPRRGARAGALSAIVFTTHTPVPAGNDTYPLDQLARVAGAFAAEAGIGVDALAGARPHATRGRPASRSG